MNARWIEINVPQAHAVAGYKQWALVDDDDEIIATVSGVGQMWNAQVGQPNYGQLGSNGKSGAFISDVAAKKKIEGWLSGAYTFVGANATAWAYMVAP